MAIRASPGMANALTTRLRNPEPPSRFRREGTGETLGAALFGVDIGPQARFISAESFLVPAAGGGKFTRQHVGGYHGKRRALPCQEGHAERRIARKRHAALRPVWHPDLADAVEINLVCAIQFIKNALAFPFPVAIPLA